MAEDLQMPAQIEAALMQQEHRLFHVFYNFFVRRREFAQDDVRRAAATSAFLWRLISPSSLATGSVGVAAIVGLFIAYQANTLLRQANNLLEEQNLKVDKQNELLQTQNQKVEEQNMLAESSRRAGLIFELTAIFDRINEELNQLTLNKQQDAEGAPKGAFPLKERTIGRIIALSRSLRPYRYLDDEGKLLQKPMSPERGQLLISLLASGVDMKTIAQQGLFSQAELRGANLQRADLRGADLRGADLRGADLLRAFLQRVNLQGGVLRGAFLYEANLQGANLTGADLPQANLPQADLRGAVLRGADLQRANLTGADLRGADLEKARLLGAILQEADLQEVKNLTQDQLNEACVNENTKLPPALTKPPPCP